MSRMALCAGLNKTIKLRGCKAFYTLPRCTILVKDKKACFAVLDHVLQETSVISMQNRPFFASMRQFSKKPPHPRTAWPQTKNYRTF